MLKGIDVILYEKHSIGLNGFGSPIYEETPVVIENVLVAPVSSDNILDNVDVKEKTETYQLAIPKGDDHDWINAKVEFFGKTWETVGTPLEGIEELIPLSWNRKVLVRRIG